MPRSEVQTPARAEIWIKISSTSALQLYLWDQDIGHMDWLIQGYCPCWCSSPFSLCLPHLGVFPFTLLRLPLIFVNHKCVKSKAFETFSLRERRLVKVCL